MTYLHFDTHCDHADTLICLLGVGDLLPPCLRQVDDALNGAVSLNIEKERFAYTKGEVLEMTTNGHHPVHRIILVGAGDTSQLTPLELQELGGSLSEFLKGDKICLEASFSGLPEIAFGLELRKWRFDKYRTIKRHVEADITFLTDHPETCRKGFAAIKLLVDGVRLARELTAEPANHLYPAVFAKRCEELVKEGIEVAVYDELDLEKMGANALLCVGKGSTHPPRLVTMQWKGGKEGQPPVALVGKGVCYDSGGINLKTKELVEMKFDKAGAAAVAGTLLALAKQKAPVNAVGVIGLAENMPDGGAMKPGDIVSTLSKLTVEIVDTDYEGRLILADCLWFAQEKYKPSVVIDLGTLTPEVLAPLADEYAGLYSGDDQLSGSLLRAGVASGEKLWPLPMGPRFAKQIESDYADLKNMGMPGFGECGAAAEFLKRFIQPGVRWAHLDIAGVAWTLDHYPLNSKGITGFGVRLLVALLKLWQDPT